MLRIDSALTLLGSFGVRRNHPKLGGIVSIFSTRESTRIGASCTRRFMIIVVLRPREIRSTAVRRSMTPVSFNDYRRFHSTKITVCFMGHRRGHSMIMGVFILCENGQFRQTTGVFTRWKKSMISFHENRRFHPTKLHEFHAMQTVGLCDFFQRKSKLVGLVDTRASILFCHVISFSHLIFSGMHVNTCMYPYHTWQKYPLFQYCTHSAVFLYTN